MKLCAFDWITCKIQDYEVLTHFAIHILNWSTILHSIGAFFYHEGMQREKKLKERCKVHLIMNCHIFAKIPMPGERITV